MSEPTNDKTGKKWDPILVSLTQAALSGQPDAQSKLGMHLLDIHGKLVEHGSTEATIFEILARELFRKATEQGYEKAMKQLQAFQNDT